MNNLPNSKGQVFIEKLLVPQIVEKLFALKEPEGSFTYSQQPNSGSYTDRHQSSPRPTTDF
jgi:hypothetical protein